MSNVYATEPPTSGRVIFETTHGPLELQLWCKECPETTRHFLQLCRDGYYDDTIFHRIVPKFLIQTGAVRSPATNKKKNGGAENAPATRLQEALEREAADRRKRNEHSFASYRRAIHADRALERRRYEVHSRLRFSHRGIVAMALTAVPQEGGKDDNDQGDDAEWMQPQFFVTLDEAPFLDGRHVVFGSCVGPTYFNAVRISQVDVDEAAHAPTEWREAPRVLRTKIVEVPPAVESQLVDVPDARVPWKQKVDGSRSATESTKKKKKKRKGRLDVNVLSFGDEVAAEELVEPPVVLPKRATDPGRGGGLIPTQRQDEEAGSNGAEESHSSAARTKAPDGASSSPVPQPAHDNGDRLQPAPNDSEDRGEFDRREVTKAATQVLAADANGTAIHRPTEGGPSAPVVTRATAGSLVEARKAQFAAQRAARLRGSLVDKRQREDDTMAKLAAFQSHLKGTAAATTTSTATMADAHRSGGGGGGDAKGGGLASRMARRALEESRGDDVAGAADDVPTYHGQVLEDDGDDELPGEAGKVRDEWMRTTFRCRRSAADGDALVGGDGRRADDYQVLDDRDRRRSRSKDHHDRSDRHKAFRPSTEDRHRDHRKRSKRDGHRER